LTRMAQPRAKADPIRDFDARISGLPRKKIDPDGQKYPVGNITQARGMFPVRAATVE
jgi:hypothetical protein